MWWRPAWFSLKGKGGIRGQRRDAVLPHPAFSTNQPADPCTTAARAAAEPAIALGGALGSLRDGLRATVQAPHLRPPLFVRSGPIPDQGPSAKGSGASPDRTLASIYMEDLPHGFK